ncbi:MAG: hypothetical protein Q4G13_02405 [Moraxella sp.]|nr:hypothetical protein [Moraxella sp.]
MQRAKFTPRLTTLQRTTPRLTTLSMAVSLLLAGCQSVSDGGVGDGGVSNGRYFVDGVSQAEQTKQVFAQFNQTAQANAKTKLLTALQAHYTKDRVAITNIYHQEMPLAQTDLNQGADPLVSSALKTMNYSRQETSAKTSGSSAYRTMSDYLDESDEPLLRYYDEKNGVVPAHAISRIDGLLDDYSANIIDLKSLDMEYYYCIAEHSRQMNELVLANPRLTVKDTAYKAQQTILRGCMAQVDTQKSALASQLSSYQVQDIQELKYCVQNYQRDVDELFAVNRHKTYRAYEGGTQDYHEIAYENYATCNTKFVTEIKSDPVDYIAQERTPTQLELMNLWRECTIDYQNQEKALRTQGKNLSQHAPLFIQLYYDSYACIDNALEQVYGTNVGGSTPTTIAQAQIRQDVHAEAMSLFEQALYGEDDDDDSHARKGLGAAFGKYLDMKRAELSENKASDTSNDKVGGTSDDKPSDKQNDKPSDTSSNSEPTQFGSLYGIYGRKMGGWLQELAQSPAQLHAKNLYRYHPSYVQVVSRHLPSQKRYASMMSFEYRSATAEQSVRLPYFVDFEQGIVRADVSAVMPVVALINPQHALLPQDFAQQEFGVIDFGLPEPLKDTIPTVIIYDTLNNGITQAMAQISPRAFTDISLDGDEFARSVGARTAVQVSLNAKEQGEFLAGLSKILIKELSAYVDAHPEYYEDTDLDSKIKRSKIKQAIETWALLDKGFWTDDVGGLMQAIEGVLPFGLYQTNTYYMDSKGEIVGQTNQLEIQSPMRQSVSESVSFTRFGTHVGTRFGVNRDERQIVQTLDSLMNTAGKDGNAWLKNMVNERKYEGMANRARSNYAIEQKIKIYEAEQAAKRNGE